MSIAWTCVLIERDPTTGAETETVVPVDQEQIVLHGRETFVPVPLEWRNRLSGEKCLREINFGWRDTSTHHWIQDNELFGGYVQRTTHRKDGGETAFGVYASDYDDLLTRTTTRGYPGDPLYIDPFGTLPHTIREYHIPTVLGDPTVDGYPVGWKAADMIASSPGGGVPDGILLTFLNNNIAIGTIDAAFSSSLALFDLTARPTNTAILGHCEGLSLRSLLEVILACNGLLQPDVKPWYFMRAILDPGDNTKIIPEFNLVDLNGDLTPDWYFDDADTSTVMWSAGDAPGTVYTPFADLTVEHDATNLRTQVTVFGVGSSQRSDDFLTHEKLYQRVIGDWPSNDSEVTAYQNPFPTKYQRIPGWGGEVIVTDIAGNLASYPPHHIADQLAQLIGHALSKPAIRVSFTTFVPVKKGQIINIVDTTTGLNGNYPVLDVTGGGVLRQYSVTAGYEPPTAQDFLSGPKMQLLKLALLGITRNTSGKGPNFYNPNVPGGGAPNRFANNNQHNAVASVTDTVAALSPQGPVNVSQVTPDGMPIGTDANNYMAAPITATPPLRPSLVPTVDGTLSGDPNPNYYIFPTPRYFTMQAASPHLLMEWDRSDGSNGPFHWHVEADEDGVFDIYYPDKVLITRCLVVREYDESGNRVVTPTATASLLLENLTTHAMDIEITDVDSNNPLCLEVDPTAPETGRALQCKLIGLESGHVAKLEVSERNLAAAFYGL